MVVDHVEDDLDPGLVQAAGHQLELVHVAARRKVARRRREEPGGVVAPVVRQAALGQVSIVEERLHRHQLDRGDAELHEVIDYPRVRETAEAAAHLRRDVAMKRRHALDVRLVDDRVGPGVLRPDVRPPGHRRVNHLAFRHDECRVAPVERQIPAPVTDPIAEHSVMPADLAMQRQCVRVEQQLVGVEAVPVTRLVGTMHPVAVELTGAHLGQIAMPDFMGVFRQRDAGDLAAPAVVEEAQLHLRRVRGEKSEVDPRTVPGRAERKRAALAQDIAFRHSTDADCSPKATRLRRPYVVFRVRFIHHPPPGARHSCASKRATLPGGFRSSSRIFEGHRPVSVRSPRRAQATAETGRRMA